MNVVVGQSGGPTAVINASLAGVYEAAVRLGADKIYGMKNGVEGFLQENFLPLKEVLDTPMKVVGNFIGKLARRTDIEKKHAVFRECPRNIFKRGEQFVFRI